MKTIFKLFAIGAAGMGGYFVWTNRQVLPTMIKSVTNTLSDKEKALVTTAFEHGKNDGASWGKLDASKTVRDHQTPPPFVDPAFAGLSENDKAVYMHYYNQGYAQGYANPLSVAAIAEDTQGGPPKPITDEDRQQAFDAGVGDGKTAANQDYLAKSSDLKAPPNRTPAHISMILLSQYQSGYSTGYAMFFTSAAVRKLGDPVG